MEGKQPKRSTEIIEAYFDFLDRHIEDVITGKATAFMELGQIAQELAISHGHLSDTVRKIKGKHPCYFYDAKIIERARQMLLETDRSIAHIAMLLTYDPSNFSKFFKKWTGETPGTFRKNHRNRP